jgi:hypothetical protein
MRTRLTLLLLVAPIMVWTLFGFLGERAASSLSSRFGARILASGDGKFTNPQPFVKRRLKELAVLATSACLLILVHRGLAALAARRLQTPARWIIQGWSAFICLNVFAAVAAHTVLFWTLLYTGKEHINNYTQYRIKQGLLEEAEAPSQAVLMGASQTRTQIDTKVLNKRMGRKIWTTELHFPGSTVYDMVLCLERLPKVRLDYVITYFSEANLYCAGDSQRLMYFFGVRDLANYWTLGPGKPGLDNNMVRGLMGDIFPLYRVWGSFIDRAQFWQTQNLKQAQYNATLESDLVERAQRQAKSFSLGPYCRFQKWAFATFAKMCRERGCRLVVCCGQTNPILDRALDPAVRRDMMAFLHEQAGQDPNLILLEDPQLPRQVKGDYDDLTHVNEAARARFSQYMAEALEKLARTNPPSGPANLGLRQK